MRVCRILSSCLVRQVNEAVRIGMCNADCLMNSNAEFHQAPLVRVVPTMGLLDEQEDRAEGAPRRQEPRGVRREGARGGQRGQGRARTRNRGQ